MPRRPTGANEHASIAAARQLLTSAKTADELRTAQAVLLPLENELSLAKVSEIVGRSVSWVTHERRRFIQTGAVTDKGSWGGRRRELVDADLEEKLVKRAVMAATGTDRGFYSELRKLLKAYAPPGSKITKSTMHSIVARVAPRVIPGTEVYEFRSLIMHLKDAWHLEKRRSAEWKLKWEEEWRQIRANKR